MNPTILLADDHIMVSKGLRRLLEMDFGYRQCHSVTSCSELMKELKKNTYTHLVLDIGLSDGSTLEVLPTIQNLYPSLSIMIFSAKSSNVFDKAFKHLNVKHYLSKESSEEDSIRCFKAFFLGRLARQYEDPSGSNNPFASFSTRELEILHYLVKGLGTNEIAANLNLKHNTISTVKKRIFEKTEVNNIKELMDLAVVYKI